VAYVILVATLVQEWLLVCFRCWCNKTNMVCCCRISCHSLSAWHFSFWTRHVNLKTTKLAFVQLVKN